MPPKYNVYIGGIDSDFASLQKVSTAQLFNHFYLTKDFVRNEQ